MGQHSALVRQQPPPQLAGHQIRTAEAGTVSVVVSVGPTAGNVDGNVWPGGRAARFVRRPIRSGRRLFPLGPVFAGQSCYHGLASGKAILRLLYSVAGSLRLDSGIGEDMDPVSSGQTKVAQSWRADLGHDPRCGLLCMAGRLCPLSVRVLRGGPCDSRRLAGRVPPAVQGGTAVFESQPATPSTRISNSSFIDSLSEGISQNLYSA